MIKKQAEDRAGTIMATQIKDTRTKKTKDSFRIKNMRFVLEIFPPLSMKASYKVYIFFFRYFKQK